MEVLGAAEQHTCHGENPNQQVDVPVSEENHFGSVSIALPLSPLGFSGCPQTRPQNQGVKEHHRNHTRDVQSHDGQTLRSTLTDRWTEWKINTDTALGQRTKVTVTALKTVFEVYQRGNTQSLTRKR